MRLSLIEAVIGAVDVPVTLKMRLGWDHDSLNAPYIARRAEQAGVRMITVHGRTRCQFYDGAADWAASPSDGRGGAACPSIANGDIVDGATAARALALSGAAGVMVGRGAIGKPWLLAEIAGALEGRSAEPAPARGGVWQRWSRTMHGRIWRSMALRTGVKAMRKHLDAYLAQVPGGAVLRGESDPGKVTLRGSWTASRGLARWLPKQRDKRHEHKFRDTLARAAQSRASWSARMAA